MTGKPAGDDLIAGKRTVLVALALDAASPEAAAEPLPPAADVEVVALSLLEEHAVSTSAAAIALAAIALRKAGSVSLACQSLTRNARTKAVLPSQSFTSG